MDSVNLRFRAAETDAAPPELASFVAVDRSLLGEQEADHDDRTPLADLVAAGIVHQHVRLVVDDEPGVLGGPVFVTLRATPIPAPEVPEVAPEVAAFVLVDRVHGHFAWPAARQRGSAQIMGIRASSSSHQRQFVFAHTRYGWHRRRSHQIRMELR